MTQADRVLVMPPGDEGEVDRRYQAILQLLGDLLPDHGELLFELDAVVSELLAEADDRARLPGPPGSGRLSHVGGVAAPGSAGHPVPGRSRVLRKCPRRGGDRGPGQPS